MKFKTRTVHQESLLWTEDGRGRKKRTNDTTLHDALDGFTSTRQRRGSQELVVHRTVKIHLQGTTSPTVQVRLEVDTVVGRLYHPESSLSLTLVTIDESCVIPVITEWIDLSGSSLGVSIRRPGTPRNLTREKNRHVLERTERKSVSKREPRRDSGIRSKSRLRTSFWRERGS